jgi:hypothetical protein
MDHTFVIPVYGAAPKLGALCHSLRDQSGGPSEIRLSTSTPSAELDAFSKRHAIPLHINPQRLGIAADWNFALSVPQTTFVTLAHQDDLFDSEYATHLSGSLRRNPAALLAFCDYSEHSFQGPRRPNINLRIKRALRRRAFGVHECIDDPRKKVRLLSLGNPICCPSVMFARSMLRDFKFPEGFQTNLDWMAWLGLARRPGGFVYLRECLVSKGVHPASETTAAIANRAREREDRILFDALWPRPVAAMLAEIYKLGYRSNRL